uniref:DsbA family oxidoreductase n=1 Tax=Thaumasiovibrio occultus TaxID=1891184 RepID=UPI000B34AF27|nr:DsbA family oxidoreductase [Thaumasiovibrio occultus]
MRMSDLKVDVVVDICCPWSAVSYFRLLKAMENLPRLRVNLSFHGYELYPRMLPEGMSLAQHMMENFGMTHEDWQENTKQLTAIGETLGFNFHFTDDKLLYNTFDAHRFLYVAKGSGKQQAVVKALFSAYFSENRNPSALSTLNEIARELELEHLDIAKVLETDKYRPQVRHVQEYYRQLGVRTVPSFIFDSKFLLSGAQSQEALEQALQEMTQ